MVALWRPSALAFELTYFWALTATVQALLTPDFLAWGRRRTPRPGAVRGVLLWSLAVTGLAAAGCLVTGGNYMFLRRPLPGGSLLDLIGPRPWYVVTGTALAAALFWLLDRPFAGRPERRPAG